LFLLTSVILFSEKYNTMTDNLLNVEIFASVSGISFNDKSTLVKMYGLKVEKSYEDWYNLTSKDFNIPKDLRINYVKPEAIEEDFQVEEESVSQSKEILKKIKEKNNNKSI